MYFCMYVCMCVCVCMFVCIFVCVYVCMYVCNLRGSDHAEWGKAVMRCVCMYVYTCIVRICTFTRPGLYTYVYAYIHNTYLFVIYVPCMHVFTYMHIHTYIHICICTLGRNVHADEIELLLREYVCMYVCMCVCMH